MKSLYQTLVDAGIQTDHHESDLYVLNTPEARTILTQDGRTFTAFRSQVDGRSWLDVPFAYEPWWTARQPRLPGDVGAVRDQEHPLPPVAVPQADGYSLTAPEETEHTQTDLFRGQS